MDGEKPGDGLATSVVSVITSLNLTGGDHDRAVGTRTFNFRRKDAYFITP